MARYRPPTLPVSGMRLGQMLALARELKGWTIRDLEKRTGISDALISQIEIEHVKSPGFHLVVKLSRALGIKLDRLAETAFDAKDYGAR